MKDETRSISSNICRYYCLVIRFGKEDYSQNFQNVTYFLAMSTYYLWYQQMWSSYLFVLVVTGFSLPREQERDLRDMRLGLNDRDAFSLFSKLETVPAWCVRRSLYSAVNDTMVWVCVSLEVSDIVYA